MKHFNTAKSYKISMHQATARPEVQPHTHYRADGGSQALNNVSITNSFAAKASLQATALPDAQVPQHT